MWNRSRDRGQLPLLEGPRNYLRGPLAAHAVLLYLLQYPALLVPKSAAGLPVLFRSRAVVLNWGPFRPFPGDTGNVGRHSGYYDLEQRGDRHPVGRGQGAANRSTTHKAAPREKHDPAPNGNNAAAGKPRHGIILSVGVGRTTGSRRQCGRWKKQRREVLITEYRGPATRQADASRVMTTMSNVV